MNAHVLINYELELHLKYPYIPMEEVIMNMLNEDDVVDNGQIGDVVGRVGFKDAKSASIILKQFLEQRPTNVTPLI